MEGDDRRPAVACERCGAPGDLLVGVAGTPARRCSACVAFLAERARARLRGGRWIAGCFLVFGVTIGAGGAIFTALSGRPAGELDPADILIIGPLEGLITAYAAWSLFWGVPAAVRWWMGISDRVARRLGWGVSLLPLAPLFLTFLIPVVLGAWYGFLGGAFYERWKCRKLAAGVRAD